MSRHACDMTAFLPSSVLLTPLVLSSAGKVPTRGRLASLDAAKQSLGGQTVN